MEDGELEGMAVLNGTLHSLLQGQEEAFLRIGR